MHCLRRHCCTTPSQRASLDISIARQKYDNPCSRVDRYHRHPAMVGRTVDHGAEAIVDIGELSFRLRDPTKVTEAIKIEGWRSFRARSQHTCLRSSVKNGEIVYHQRIRHSPKTMFNNVLPKFISAPSNRSQEISPMRIPSQHLCPVQGYLFGASL